MITSKYYMEIQVTSDIFRQFIKVSWIIKLSVHDISLVLSAEILKCLKSDYMFIY